MKRYGQQAGIYSLNKGWKFIEQDFSVLPIDRSHSQVYAYAKAGTTGGPASPIFNDEAWETVELPHDWVNAKPITPDGAANFGYKNRGIGWYRIKFHLKEEDRGKQILLEFEGMSSDAEIYCNGQLVKRNFSGYASFSVDITDMTNYGDVPNLIAVRINASKWEGWWYEGAGIYRNVWLIKKEPVHIAYNGVFIKPEKKEEDRWNLQAYITLENSLGVKQRYCLETKILDPDGACLDTMKTEGVLEGYETEEVLQAMDVISPQIWDIDRPFLYTAVTSVRYEGETKDYLKTSFGFRTIRMDADTGFWLNETNIKLKGFCNHQDHAGVGVAVPYAIKEYRMQLIKGTGANACRLAHNPDPEILDICDRLGLLVMDENRTFSTEEGNMDVISNWIKTSRNHPSVIFYSIFNEEPLQGAEKGRKLAERIQAQVKKLDSSRYVLGAFNGGYLEKEGAASVLDVTGINYGINRYDEFHRLFPKTPAVGSETSSAFMVRGEYSTDYSRHVIGNYDEEAAPWGATIRDTWKAVNERPFIAGSFVWTGFDYGGEPSPFEWPSVSSFFGVFDRCGFKKDAYYLYKAFWSGKPVLHILPHWNHPGKEGQPIKVAVFTNCEEVEIRLNGRKVARLNCDPYDMAECEILYEKGVLEAVGYQNGKEMAVTRRITSSGYTRLKLEVSKRELKNDGKDAVAVNVYAVDADGQKDVGADDMVVFHVLNGTVLGVGNGNPNSHEADYAKERKMFHGCVQAIVKNNGAEDVCVRVETARGVTSSIVIPVTKTDAIEDMEPVMEQIVVGWKMYKELSDEFPQLDFSVTEHDMNSFEPVEFEGRLQAAFKDQYGKYGIYRVMPNLEKGSKYFYFEEIVGDVWIYVDDQRALQRVGGEEGRVILEIPEEMEGKHLITVVIQNVRKNWSAAGIAKPVFLVRNKRENK